MEADPFPSLSIDSADFLDDLPGRGECPRCGKSRKFFCYSCHVALPGIQDKIPQLKLPVQIDVIKHSQEVDGKCTSAPAAILAPDNITIYTYPDIPDYLDKSKVLIIFPGKDAMSLGQYAEKFCRRVNRQDAYSPVNNFSLSRNTNPAASGVDVSEETTIKVDVSEETTIKESECDTCDSSEIDTIGTAHSNNTDNAEDLELLHLDQGYSKVTEEKLFYKPEFERVIFIDCTWFQVPKICPDERLKGIQSIELSSHTTKFWRHQYKKPPGYLSTVEAMYYFLREYHQLFMSETYRGEYDNLLFFFLYTYHKIRRRYDPSDVPKAYLQ